MLGEKIKKVIQIARGVKDEFDPITILAVSAKIAELKQLMEDNLDQLKSTDDLRVYDGEKGGCLRGNAKGRKKYEFCHKLLCHKNYMKHSDSKTPSEVSYMRALFNNRKIDDYNIVSYETPLMRKKTKNKNPGIGGKALACDLFGINKNELCCIEIKTVPDNDATKLPYALLEGFAYAVCLKWIVKNCPADLREEIRLCCRDFGFSTSLCERPFEKVTFAVAGPEKDYFAPYAQQKFKNHYKKWFVLRLKETRLIQNIIQSEYKGLFAGYLVLGQSVDDCIKVDTEFPEIVEPVFRIGMNIYPTINGILEKLR